ncbi:MAG: ATP-binding protein [Spiroplasmataceae bacterium]|nr:ATP-binding protein [Spiroplasmataceae bacterium]
MGLIVIIASIMAILMWKGYQINWTRFEIEHSEGLEAKKEKDKLDKEHKQAQIDATKGWQANDSDYNIQASLTEEECFEIDRVDPQGTFKRKLFWSEEITNFFKNILKDLEDLTQKGSVDLNLDEKKDGHHRYFKRRNCVLYGAAGTGKTEFIKQMARIIQAKYPEWIADDLDPNNSNYEFLKQIERKIPPIIQIDGTNIKAPGKGSPVGDKIDSYEKLIKIIERAKESYFGDKYSDKPYIVFIEEADQGINVMDTKQGKLLEDWKNFMSTPRDHLQLKGKAQDYNSCIIIATNNYENIDKPLFRRGRLGKKLNFNWNPHLLKNYLKYWYEKDDQLKNLGFSLSESEEWDWEKNSEPEELYKITTRIGFDVAKTELAPNLPIVYRSWQNLSEEEKKLKANELGTKKDKNNKEICNWLLHYLYTFHQYNDKRQLDSFNDANLIQRYNYGHEYRMEELSRNSIIQICNNVIALKDAVATGLAQIRAEMAANFEETSILKQEILMTRAELKKVEENISSIRSSIPSTSGIWSELNSLQSQINTIVSQINSGSFGGSSSSSSQTVQKYSDLSQAVSRFTKRMKDYLEGGGSDTNTIRQIVNDLIDDIKSV